MTLELQFKIKNNPRYIQYIREHSYWYKLLNRDPLLFKNFEENVRETYKLRVTDRISKALSTIELFQNIVSSLK